MSNDLLSFESLVENIGSINEIAGNRAKGAVNQLMTARNWAIGYYIVEFEQNGADRAKYGTHLLKDLEKQLNIKGLNVTLFQLSRTFYLRYPQIRATASREFSLPENTEKYATVSHKFETDPKLLISILSFSHIREIMRLDDPMERFFYETECIRCGWSVRELRRQISTNLFFRAGISNDPESLLAQTVTSGAESNLTVKDPFTFEFLGLDASEYVTESELEQRLIDNMGAFMLELGKGYCFEARQKRIIIDDRYYFADLVFYNRLLHCNVIMELKNDEFKHEYLGQLNAYVAYYKDKEMVEGDNPPVGILLCTHKGPQMVEYALAGMDNKLFVSTYMLHLPDKSQLESFLLSYQ